MNLIYNKLLEQKIVLLFQFQFQFFHLLLLTNTALRKRVFFVNIALI